MEFQVMVDKALKIREQYSEKEKQLYGSAWTNEEITLGFVSDMGDLAKLVVAQNGKRNIQNNKEKLAHELSDCLWSIIVLANEYGIELEKNFFKTMNEIEKQINGKIE